MFGLVQALVQGAVFQVGVQRVVLQSIGELTEPGCPVLLQRIQCREETGALFQQRVVLLAGRGVLKSGQAKDAQCE